MRFTVRLDNDDYLEIDLDTRHRVLSFLSPIPNVEIDKLMEFAEHYSYALHLPITEQAIIPDSKPDAEKILKEFVSQPENVIEYILILANHIIAEG